MMGAGSLKILGDVIMGINTEEIYWNERYNNDERTNRIMCEDISCAVTQPSVIYRPEIYKDGDMWYCILGDDIQTGICGFGKTPELACKDFNRVFEFGEDCKWRKTD